MLFDIENLCFAYRDRQILKGIYLQLEAGHFYGVVGPNGCGKTTLTDLLLRHKSPSSGIIRYEGKDLTAYSKKELARKMALVPQIFDMNFPFPAGEVVMMGRYPYIPRFSAPSAEDIAVVREIMVQTDTLKFEDRLMTELSGGERQRVIFARALAQQTPVLFLDEATSNLDIRHTLTLMEIAAHRCESEGKTAIAVIQDINLAATYCDCLIFMKDGQIAAFGKTQDGLAEENLKLVFDVESQVVFEPYSNSKKAVFRRKATHSAS